MFFRWKSMTAREFFLFIFMSGILLFLFFAFPHIHTEKGFCWCNWGCLGKELIEVDPLVELKRHISSILLKAANDVRRGRQEMAVADLQSAAAILDFRLKLMDAETKPIVLSPKPIFLPTDSDSTLTLAHLQNLVDNMSLREFDVHNLLYGNMEKKYVPPDKRANYVSEKVTVVIDDCGEKDQENAQTRLNNLISQIRDLWPNIKIVIGTSLEPNKLQILTQYQGVSIMKIQCDISEKSPMENLLANVETAFILYLNSCSAVTSDLDLFKLLTLAGDIGGVGVVGMAERGADGAWDYTCMQLRHENFRLTLINGYDYSKGSCIFCDVSSKSFLAATKVIKAVLPDSSLPDFSLQIDWALRLRMAGVLTVTCPEIMTHTSKNVIPTEKLPEVDQYCTTKKDKIQAREESLVVKRLYRKLAQKWQLTTIHLFNNTSLEYNCLEIHFDCNARTHVTEYILPSCCLKLKHKMFQAIDLFTKESLIPYEMQAGTLLGAVKFKDALPWDFDDDCHYPNKYVKIFKNNKHTLQDMGIPSITYSGVIITGHNSHEYFIMSGKGGFSFDLWGVDSLKSEASREKLETFPGNLVCLQYGHYPVRIDTFLNGADEVTKNIILKRNESVASNQVKRLFQNKKKRKHKTASKTFPPIPKKTCFLQSFVRLGEKWAIAGWNPGLDAKKKFGENIFRHRAHWRFEKNNYSWPSCSFPGHTMCLDIHPMDGSIPFM